MPIVSSSCSSSASRRSRDRVRLHRAARRRRVSAGAARCDAGARSALRRSGCGTAIVVTPHNVHVEGHYAVVTAARVGAHETDRTLAAGLVAMRCAPTDLPVVGVSYGGNDAAEAEMPLDWGTEVPLRVRARSAGRRRRACTRPAARRARPVGRSDCRGDRHAPVALDRERGPRPRPRCRGPVRLRQAAARYDERFLALLGSEPLDFRPLGELVEAAKADSLWQLLDAAGSQSPAGPSSSRTRPRRTTGWRSRRLIEEAIAERRKGLHAAQEAQERDCARKRPAA